MSVQLERPKRSIRLLTDDAEEAFKKLRALRETGEKGWDLAEVRFMANPPHTMCRYCVYRVY